jgi:dTDP-4-dehydrorhamnose reductase
MKRILLIGKNGQVGWELHRTLAPLGDVIAVGRNELDLAKSKSIRNCIRESKPDCIVNVAAYTAVDLAEQEQDLAFAINADAPAVLAEEAKAIGATLIHYSTDYVFDGTKSDPYSEEDSPNPLGVYGKSKLAGEEAISASGCNHLILRTSWVYGARGHNFLQTMLRLAKERKHLRVVNDQTGAPTWSRMIAEATALMLFQKFQRMESSDNAFLMGIFNLSGGESTTWYGFAQEIFCIASAKRMISMPQLDAIPSSEYPTPAARPSNSILDNQKLFEVFGISLPSWREGVALCLDELSVTIAS